MTQQHTPIKLGKIRQTVTFLVVVVVGLIFYFTFYPLNFRQPAPLQFTAFYMPNAECVLATWQPPLKWKDVDPRSRHFVISVKDVERAYTPVVTLWVHEHLRSVDFPLGEGIYQVEIRAVTDHRNWGLNPCATVEMTIPRHGERLITHYYETNKPGVSVIQGGKTHVEERP